jgi:hypothetical protein
MQDNEKEPPMETFDVRVEIKVASRRSPGQVGYAQDEFWLTIRATTDAEDHAEAIRKVAGGVEEKVRERLGEKPAAPATEEFLASR